MKILLADQNNLEDVRNIKRSSITGLKQRMEIISVMMLEKADDNSGY